MLMIAFFRQDGKAVQNVIDRFAKLPNAMSDNTFLRFAEFARDTLEGKPQVADASREKAPLIPTFILRPTNGQAPGQAAKPEGAVSVSTGVSAPVADLGQSTLLDDSSLRPVDDLEE
jgi:hypothetical protein